MYDHDEVPTADPRHLYLLLRRASLLASADDTLHPGVRYHLAVTELHAWALASEGASEFEPLPDDDLDYPLSAGECITQAYRVGMAIAVVRPGGVSPDLLWALGSVRDEYLEHDAELTMLRKLGRLTESGASDEW